MQIGRQVPGEGAHGFAVVRPLAVQLALLLDEAAGGQGLVPLVEVVAAFEEAVFVFDDVALVEAERGLERNGVHLADVDAVVAGGGQLLDPGPAPLAAVAEYAGGVGIEAVEEAGTGGHAGGGGDVALVEADAFADQAVEVGRVDVGVPERGDGVVALLVGDDQDDVRSPAGGRRRHQAAAKRFQARA